MKLLFDCRISGLKFSTHHHLNRLKRLISRIKSGLTSLANNSSNLRSVKTGNSRHALRNSVNTKRDRRGQNGKETLPNVSCGLFIFWVNVSCGLSAVTGSDPIQVFGSIGLFIFGPA